MRNRVYISGAITGTTDYKERFEQAEKMLEEKYRVVNPVSLSRELEKHTQHYYGRVPTWEEYMKNDMSTMLRICDKLYMLKGWEASKGATIEHELAQKLGYTIIYEE